MQLRSLSASSGQVFEMCEARWKAEYRDKTERLAASSGNLGSCVHETLEMFVKLGNLAGRPFHELKMMYDIVYYKYFSDLSQYEVGRQMLQDWFQRQTWDGREVILVEEKRQFPIKVDGMEVPFSFIFDRLDRLENGDLEVVDYKSWMVPKQPDDLRTLIQPRTYSLAVRTLFPEHEGTIWVTYDQLRYDSVSAAFTRDDDIATYRYLQELVRRITRSDGSIERLNPECKWCVRRMECKTLKSHLDGGGVLTASMGDIESAVDHRAEVKYAVDALNQLLADLDQQIIEEMERREVTEIETAKTKAKISVYSQRAIDPDRAAQLLGPELMAKYGSIGVTKIDHILKHESGLDDSRKSMLRQSIRKEVGKASLKTSPTAPLE